MVGVASSGAGSGSSFFVGKGSEFPI